MEEEQHDNELGEGIGNNTSDCDDVKSEEIEAATNNKEANENHPQDDYEYELITNIKEYLFEDLADRKKAELVEYVIYNELLIHVSNMENIPECPLVPISSENMYLKKRELCIKLQVLKDYHFKKYHFYDQLQQVTLASPDTDDRGTMSLPESYQPVKYDKDGNKIYM
jgi:hypothetical protein